MKTILKFVLLFSLFITVSAQAQTVKKTATPVKKTTAKKLTSAQTNAAKTAAAMKAKEDSVAAVNALAMKLAKQIITEDSIKKAQTAQQMAMDEKSKQNQLKTEKKGKPEKTVKQKPVKKEVAQSKSVEATNEKKIPDELRPTAKPEQINDPKIWLGLRGLGIASFITGEDIGSDLKPYIGYGGGLVVNFGLGSHFSFQPEVLYAQEGFSIDEEDDGQRYKGSVFANVIQVPLLIKYSFAEHNQGFFVNAGPYGNYIINTVLNDKSGDTGKTKINPDKTTIEYGIAAGLGAAFPVGKGRLLVEARGTYYIGSTEDNFNSDAKIITGAISVGYLFPLGR